jgi:hypothetical protein
MHPFILHNKYPALHQGMYESNKILVIRKLFNKIGRSCMWGRLMNIKAGEMAIIKFVSHEGTFLMMKKNLLKFFSIFLARFLKYFGQKHACSGKSAILNI